MMLVAGEVFAWRPWNNGGVNASSLGKVGMINTRGQWEIGDEGWGVLEVVWPKPGEYGILIDLIGLWDR